MFDFLAGIFGIEDEPTTRKGRRVPLQVFLKAYVTAAKNGGNSIDVANELGITPQAVRQRASKLIKQGVKLPQLGNVARNVSVDKANEMIESLEGDFCQLD